MASHMSRPSVLLGSWVRRLVCAAAFRAAAGTCTDDSACQASCSGAIVDVPEASASSCSDAQCHCAASPCNAICDACVCDSSAVMLSGGACVELGDSAAAGSCELTHDVLINMAFSLCPDVEPAGFLDDGSPSSSFELMLYSAVANALGVAPSEVQVDGASLASPPQNPSLGSFVHSDVAFSYCTTNGAATPASREFEDLLSQGFQKFRAMQAATTVRVLDLGPHGSSNATTPAPDSSADSSSESGDSFDPWQLIVCLIILLLLVVLVAVAVKALMVHRQVNKSGRVASAPVSCPKCDRESLIWTDMKTGHYNKGWECEQIATCGNCSDTSGRLRWCCEPCKSDWCASCYDKAVAAKREAEAVQAAMPEAVVFAQVASGFHPEEVDADKLFRQSCLEIKEGERVEIIAGGGGWFYGRIPGPPERAGYFPENRVSWIGQLRLDDRCGSQLDEGLVVTVEHNFSPGDVGDGSENWHRDSCLTLEEGDVVEVTGGGCGWLYGHVRGKPERCGYFPENRATLPAQDADDAGGDDLADLEAGNFVAIVNCAFSPGGVSDAQEEAASFSDSCIAIAHGDVVEVIASAGGWLYGRVVGCPERCGYFPENRISFLGAPVQGDVAHSNAEVVGGTTEGVRADAS